MKIGDIADDKTNIASPGERFRENWLNDLPEAQWPSYIDETAELLLEDIAIGDTELTSADFSYETGRYYRRGLSKSTSTDSQRTSLPLGRASGSEIGTVMWALNRLQRSIRVSENDYSSSSRALEAVINKSLIESLEETDQSVTDFETIRLPKRTSVADLMSEIFCRPRSDQFIDALVDVAKESRTSSDGLLELLEEPRMVTTLWEHQRTALSAWLDADCRGYVDMATATGKTFLGLAAIAHHFGRLHPEDRTLTEEDRKPSTSGDATVVVVAHRSVILDQWKREFDQHLNVPEAASANSGAHTAAYTWGQIHFWTPQRLLERGVPDADLVILDETHHYLGTGGFGSILDDIDGDVLALSGSIDEENARTLERREIPKLFEFSLRDGQRVGIIPQCDWHVKVVPYEGQSTLADVTERYRSGFERYADGSAIDVLDDPSYDPDALTFDSLSEARSVSQSRAGREVKKRDDEFRKFTAALKSRGLTKYNLSPTLSAITSLTLRHVRDQKCVVLLESGDEVETVLSGLERELGDDYDDLVIDIRERDTETLAAIEAFDEEQDAGALVGTAAILGEGVDIKTADVGINRGKGQLSRALVQRVGRILRNPDGDKRATFYHVLGIPTDEEAMLPNEDGSQLLETASQLLSWGESFHARPSFETIGDGVNECLLQLEQAGATEITGSDTYSWPSREDVRDWLERLCTDVSEVDDESVLRSIEPQRDAPEASSPVDSYVSGHSKTAVRISSATWERTMAALIQEDSTQSVDAFVEEALRNQLRTVENMAEAKLSPEGSAEEKVVEINPVLRAVTESKITTRDITANEVVEWAVDRQLSDVDDRNATG